MDRTQNTDVGSTQNRGQAGWGKYVAAMAFGLCAGLGSGVLLAPAAEALARHDVTATARGSTLTTADERTTGVLPLTVPE